MSVQESRILPPVYYCDKDLRGIDPRYYESEYGYLTGGVDGVGIHQGLGASGWLSIMEREATMTCQHC